VGWRDRLRGLELVCHREDREEDPEDQLKVESRARP